MASWVMEAGEPRLSPVPVSGLLDAVTISTGGSHTCAVTTIGAVKCWGQNFSGQLGDGTTTDRSTPVTVSLTARTAPSPPTSVWVTAGDRDAMVAWSPPVFDGGSAIIGYDAIASPGGATCSTTFEMKCTVSGLTNGIPYRFSVTARNEVGGSLPSALTDAVTPASPFTSVNPERLLDTRAAQIGYAGPKPTAGQTVELQVTGSGVTDVPDDSQAVVLNITGVDATAAGHVTVWPCHSTRPNASNLNLTAGQTSPNLAISKISPDGKVCLYTKAGTHLLADITGYSLASSSFICLNPERLPDTRAAQIGYAVPKPTAGQTVELQVTGSGVTDVPDDSQAVVLNITGVDATAAGHVTVWPCHSTRPNASNLNLTASQTSPNLAISKISPHVQGVASAKAGTHLLADITGYYAASSSFTSVNPERLLDTRAAQIGYAGPKPTARTDRRATGHRFGRHRRTRRFPSSRPEHHRRRCHGGRSCHRMALPFDSTQRIQPQPHSRPDLTKPGNLEDQPRRRCASTPKPERIYSQTSPAIRRTEPNWTNCTHPDQLSLRSEASGASPIAIRSASSSTCLNSPDGWAARSSVRAWMATPTWRTVWTVSVALPLAYTR